MAYGNYPQIYPQTYYPRQEYMTTQIPTQHMPQMQQSIMRIVTSRAEAEVSQIPLDGSTAFFYNTANEEVYTRAFRADGTAPLVVYKKEHEEGPPVYVTQEQFDTLSRSFAELKSVVEGMTNE